MNDAAARERAVRDYARNVVVVAGAGTGKTTLLIERVLCQMVETGLELDRFAAITFTEKAAAELRKRLAESLTELARLAERKAEPEAADASSACGRAYRALRERGIGADRIASLALERRRSLSGAQLSTIHAFCAGLLRRYPLECGVDPGFTVDTGLGFEALKDELWSAFLVGEHGPDGVREAQWRRVLRDLDSAEVEALARALASFAPPARAAAERGVPDERAALGALASNALARISACPMRGAENGPEAWLGAARSAFEALRDGGMPAFRSALDTARWRNSRDAEKELLDGPPTSKAQPDAEALTKALHPLLRKLRLLENELLAAAVELVLPFCHAVRAEARLRGILPFDALLWLTRELLREHRDVRRNLAERYAVLFVDEFQDTDPIQYEILFWLAEAFDLFPASDAFSTRLAPGRLFIVGDPKQAIYRFRGADLAAYHAAIEHVVQRNGGVRYTLTCNWRARPEVLAPLDELLSRQLEPPTDTRAAKAYSGYDGLESGRKPAGERRVEMWRAGDPRAPTNAEGSRHAEANVIAGFIADEVTTGRARPGDFALLFRSLRGVRIYARALRERGLGCWIGRSDEPEREPAPQQLLALLRALANPADAPAVLGVLRSPLGAVPDAELARWAGTFEANVRARAWSFPDVAPPDAFPNLVRAFALLRELRTRARERAPADLVASLLEETPLAALHARARDGQRRVRDLESLLERLADAARAAPGCDLGDLVRALEASDPRSVEDDDARSDRVRLLTIHGAKGLEFETVFLPDLAWYKSSPPRNIDVEWVREQETLAVKTRAGTSASWLDFEAELALHESAELGRLFYVATTRARERLIFVDSHRKRAGARAGTLLEFLAHFPDVRDVPHPLPARLPSEPTPETEQHPAQARARAALATARTNTRLPFQSPSGVREAETARDEADHEPRAPFERPAQRIARAVGVLAHDALERWDFHDPQALHQLAREAALRAARRNALEPHLLEPEADALVDALLASDLPAHLARVEVLGRELPLLFRDADETPWSGTIDLLYRDSDGRLVIADYKTDRTPDAETRTRYRAQLAVYARAIAHAFPNEPPPVAELIFLRSGQRERLTPPNP